MSRAKTVYEFAAIDGSQFLGFLAGLGICRVLSSNGGSAKLGWRLSGGFPAPQIEAEAGLAHGNLIESLLSARAELAGLGAGWSEEFGRFSFSAETYQQFATESLSEAGRASWVSFAGAESPVFNRKGERRFSRTDLYFISGQQTFTGIAHGVAQAVTKEKLEMLFDKHPGEIPLENCDCLRFEPAEVEDHALRFINPSKDTGASNVALNYLALCALPLLSALPSPRFVKYLCSRPEAARGEVELQWRLWREFVALETALSIQRVETEAAKNCTRGYAAKAVKAVRGQNYMRMLPSVRLW